MEFSCELVFFIYTCSCVCLCLILYLTESPLLYIILYFVFSKSLEFCDFLHIFLVNCGPERNVIRGERLY